MILDADVIRVLEEVLPARFGGGPGDYQLLEQEAEDGRAEVRLLVHPRLGAIEPETLAEAFRAAISARSDPQGPRLPYWRQAGFPLIERRPPLATESGKILHFHRASASHPAR
jgi:hypothetical protein